MQTRATVGLSSGRPDIGFAVANRADMVIGAVVDESNEGPRVTVPGRRLDGWGNLERATRRPRIAAPDSLPRPAPDLRKQRST